MYFDTDGDGMPDTMVIEASVCTPDDDVIDDPEPEPIWPPDDPEGGDTGDNNDDGDDYWNDFSDSDDYVTSDKKNTYAIDNIPLTMPIQIRNLCVTGSMEYIDHLFGGNVNEGYFLQQYIQVFGLGIFDDGMDLKNVVSFVSDFFETTTFTGYQDAIDHGYVIMIDVPSDIEKSAHNVVVIGYNSDNLVYMDPETGGPKEIAEDDLDPHYKIVIIGNK